MATPMIGVSIQATDAAAAVDQIAQAEAVGIPAAWSTIGGAGGGDVMTAYASALSQTERIILGTAIVQTYPRHPVVIAQQVAALESLGPGRFRIGIGPAHRPTMTGVYGFNFDAPLTNLREYLIVLRALLHEGEVDFDGTQVTAHTRLREPTGTPIMASALRPRSFELCGELTDGAISWMCPRQYMIDEALPALRKGAEAAGRDVPPLVAHIPIAVSEDRAAVRDLARAQLANYSRTPFYLAMFERAGFGVAEDGYSDELLDGLVISGTESEVAEQLAALIDDGMGEVLAAPLIDNGDRETSIAASFAAVARAAKLVAG
ncbi:MAG TPA: LLM class flavin-dependent oxidoreductase [Dehalococcoidia bacterium]|nr:LLM class flavin-dependent oxidoreductase [Dehalococcoidia bacterium]